MVDFVKSANANSAVCTVAKFTASYIRLTLGTDY